MPVEKGVPLDVRGCAIGGNLAYPLTLAPGSIAAHPRFDVSDLTHQSILEPLFGVFQIARALMLQTDSDNPVRFPGGLEAGFSFGNGPGHRLLAIKIFPCRDGVKEMTRMTVQRAGDDDRVQVLHIEQPSMVGDGFNSRRDLA